MTNLYLLVPEISLIGLALIILLADMVISPMRSRLLYHAAILSAVLVLVTLPLFSSRGWLGVGSLWVVDPFSLYLKGLILGAALLTLFLSLDYSTLPQKHLGSFAALLLWATAGVMLLVSS
ncbi:MAG: hypothetical protein HY400_07660, partial [Elusimicrobia bacterium]|nr:hypothetical protein [Elusimicrobiota bacterium]